MAGQQGFAYESRVHNKLKSGGYVPAGFSPAGSNIRKNLSAPDGRCSCSIWWNHT